jgi:undecaprenyl phosphate N,N'-diacetylbacillosamine 1-phosphate transferase
MYRKYIKRLLDLIFALILAAPAALIIAVCCLAVKLESKGPAFFIQQRPGYKGRLFKIYKLRTMIPETQREGEALTNMQRITKSGRVIRKLSFDELPQLINVFKGDMSFIGPRPLLPSYLPLYSVEEMRRHDVLPGISGWAQVNGRNAITWEQKFALDVYYVDHISFLLDVRIFFRTIVNILRRQGINAGADETMAMFNGNEKHEAADETISV